MISKTHKRGRLNKHKSSHKNMALDDSQFRAKLNQSYIIDK